MYKTLFVDDERLIREGISNLIDWERITGQELTLAENAKVALKYLEHEKYEIVISDIYMQDMNGIELAKCIKGKWPDVVVILLSAYEDFDYARKAIEAGVFKYLLKPVIPEELEDAVNEAISQVKINEETKKRIDHSQEVLEDYRRELKKNLWKDILSGNMRNEDEIFERFEKMNMSKNISPIYVVVYKTDDESMLYQNQVAIDKVVSSCFEGYIDTVFMDNYIVILLKKENAKSVLYAFGDLVKEMFHFEVYMGEGKTVKDLSTLHMSVESAKYNIQKNRANKKDEPTQIVLAAVEMIRKEIENVDFNINTIANALYLTPAYFSRVFKRKMGMTCIDFIKNYRINLAKELLQNTDLSIQQISEKTGYATVYYFSQQFKQVTGESPGSFRKKRQKFDV
ncbi:response regulator [Blautia wexlerae]|uniref:Stage 0 sporulation protein A homolog n=1 Tax=Blautia wexlerae TaxID=418240 RepID=A0ABX2GPS9_9FIRM|nr:response regulator [Blautia wexlerae]NSF74257.1 response regulator [Blautia wexlerae]